MGKLLPTFVTPSDVDALKVQAYADYNNVDASVRACAALPAADAAAWASDFKAWQAWSAIDSSWWDAAAQYDEGQALIERARSWQTRIAQVSCAVAGPPIEPTDKPLAAADVLSTVTSVVPTVAIAGAVIAGVVLVAPIVWEALAAKRLAKRPR